jgi:hypothetical protein
MTDSIMAALPRRQPGVFLRRAADHCLLVDREGAELCAMNDTAAALWELCDGRTTVDEMVAAVCALTGGERDRLGREIADVVERLAALGAVNWAHAT